MAIVLDGTTGITTPDMTSDGGLTADGVSFASGAPANTLVTTSSGNVGIGTSSPNNALQVNSSASTTKIQLTNSTTGSTASDGYEISMNGTDLYHVNRENGSMLFYTNGSERVRIDSSGNVGIGTSSPSKKFVVSNGGANGIEISPDDVAAGVNRVLSFNRSTAAYTPLIIQGSYLRFFTSGTAANESASIDSSGNLLVGTTSQIAYGRLNVLATSATNGISCQQVTNSNAVYGGLNASGSTTFYVVGTGQIYSTSTSIGAISDQSLKENIRDLETGLTEVMALRPRRFDWKDGEGTGDKDVAGFVAQELEQVLPDLVLDYKYSEEETKKSIKMGDILPTLVKAIQEQQAIIAQLRADVAALKAKA